jgi:hypothetical protein
MSSFRDWDKEATDFLATAADAQRSAYGNANLNTCKDLVAGRDPYSGNEDGESGARMVVNISSAHIPAFCAASRRSDPKPYKNGYDLGTFRIGSPGPDADVREIVDDALPLNAGLTPKDVYFGALELAGAGIRFYGDVCLVLRSGAIAAGTLILDRNSFDLISEPLRSLINNPPVGVSQEQARRKEATDLAGHWNEDRGSMAGLRALQSIGLTLRRYTGGQIAEAIRQDEDYIEIVKAHSFSTTELQEARFSASEAAYDALTADRDNNGPPPRLEALQWRYRRRTAEKELRNMGVTVGVVTTSGRSGD